MFADAPPVHYTRAGDRQIAYQVVGDGPVDLVFLTSWFSNIELMWESPTVARFLQRLATFSRLVLLDRRGTGLSDAAPAHELTLENRVADVEAVLDAVGTDQPALLGAIHGGTAVAALAAARPDLVNALVLYNSSACVLRRDGYEIGHPEDRLHRALATTLADWGHSDLAGAPMSEAMRSWWHRYQRMSLGPTDAMDALVEITRADVRDRLPAIQAPTLVIHRVENRVMPIEHARYLAEHIPDARLLELPGSDPGWWFGPQEAVLDEIQEFLIGSREDLAPARSLATVMFTDLVESTAHAAAVGDARWRDELESHDAAVRHQLGRHDGRLIKTTGDGAVATFDRPSTALHCGLAIVAASAAMGLHARVGIHTGEIEWRGDDLTGMGVVIAARVAAAAGPDEVLVTATVRDVVVGSPHQFAPAGTHVLKGVPREWQLWRVLS